MGNITLSSSLCMLCLFVGFTSYSVEVESNIELKKEQTELKLEMTSEDELFIDAISILNKMHEEISEKHLLAKIDLLKKERDKHIDNPLAIDFISQELSVYYSFLGQHSLALVDNSPSDYQSVLPEGLSPIDAVDYISERASSLQIVMVNEAHNVAQHRVLTYQLLDKLWKHGYRYFAVEALSNEVNELLKQGYLKNSLGYYTRETIFANLLLKARKLGFKIISYDQHKSGDKNTIEERETNAALSIQELIFDKDPKAKVLFHVGYSHIDESRKWLASKLKKSLNLEVLTVDQTRLTEKAKREDESDAYLKAQAKIKTSKPVIFLDKTNRVWSTHPEKWDISVIWPRTHYEQNRPNWAQLGRRTLGVSKSKCNNTYPCLIEVYRSPVVDDIPLDRALVHSGAELSNVFLPQEESVVKYIDEENKVINIETIPSIK